MDLAETVSHSKYLQQFIVEFIFDEKERVFKNNPFEKTKVNKRSVDRMQSLQKNVPVFYCHLRKWIRALDIQRVLLLNKQNLHRQLKWFKETIQINIMMTFWWTEKCFVFAVLKMVLKYLLMLSHTKDLNEFRKNIAVGQKYIWSEEQWQYYEMQL